MKTQTFLLAALTAGTASSTPIPGNASNNDLTVQTTSGIVAGFVDPQYPSVRQFLGIPYAQPPISALRFELPQRLYSPGAYRNATAAPYACPQVASTAAGPSVFTVSAPQFENQHAWNEDCLAVSVWAPSTPESCGEKEKLPVFVWIHGGGLVSGSSSVAYQQPPAWIQRTQGHIVVEMQYRLGIFGFPNAAGLPHTNLGLLDQRMALEWARDNVAAFGGDPDRMILWGQSSGAGSVDAQNFAFPDDPIVQGFISDSGSALFPLGTGLTTADPTHSNFSTVATALGCPADPAAQAVCMRGLPAASILAFLTNYTATHAAPPLNFVATPDGRVVFADYPARYAAGRLSDRPAVFGSNTNEGVVMLPFPTNASQTPDLAAAHAETLKIYQCPAYNSARNRTAAPAAPSTTQVTGTQGKGKGNGSARKTYQYIYNGNFSDISPLPWEAAYHMSELPLIFGTRGDFRAEASAYEVETSRAMQDLWLAFARNPRNPESAGWVEFGSGKLLMLGDKGGEPVKVVDEAAVNGACVSAGLA